MRVPCGLWQRIGAAIAGMSLTHTIGRAMIQGLFTSGQPFLRTPKAEDKPALVRGLAMAREELFMLAGLIVCACTVLGVYGWNHEEAVLWAAVLTVQSVPYVAALYCSLINALPKRNIRHADAPTPSTAPQHGPLLETTGAPVLAEGFKNARQEAA